MSAARHTPGPWGAVKFGKGFLVGPIAGGLIGNVAVVYGPNVNINSSADAHLIAAAPDGLAAARLALAWMGRPGADATEEFDRLANQFRKETGFARRWKDLAPADAQNLKERQDAWSAWRREKHLAAYEALAAFIAKAEGK